MRDEINHNRKNMLQVFANADEIIKGKGEGSKGGHVIGHTKSGKPVYDKHTPKVHQNFTSKDHRDASDLHDELGAKAYDQKNHTLQGHHVAQSGLHTQFARAEKIHEDKKAAKQAKEHLNKVVGKTSTGKDIHNGAMHPSHVDFTSEEHKEAADLHHELSSKPGNYGPWHDSQRNIHHEAATTPAPSENHKALHEKIRQLSELTQDQKDSGKKLNWSHVGSLAQIHSELAEHAKDHGEEYHANEGHSDSVEHGIKRHSEAIKNLASKMSAHDLDTYWNHGNPSKAED